MVQDVLIFLMCYIIYICKVQGVFVFLMCYIIHMYDSGCVCISYVLYNR